METKYIWYEVKTAASAALSTLVPYPSARIPITWRTFPYTVIHFVPLLFMAYLVRRPDTHLVRLLLLPTVICLALRSCFGYVWPSPVFNMYNWGEGLIALLCIGKALDYAFTKNGRQKLAENRVGEVHTPAISIEYSQINGNGKEVLEQSSRSVLPTWFQDASEIFFSMRGIGWDFGKDVHVPPEFRSLERNAFIKETLKWAIYDFVMLDFLESCFKLLPGVGSPHGGTMFFPWLSPSYRYLTATVIHIGVGTAFIHGFRMVYYLLTLICVGILGHSPTSWPPLFDNPWISQSLHEFWAKRWHQILRRTFLVYGGFPCQFFLGRPGLLFGAFIASGLYHECAMYTMGRGWDDRVIFFFICQGFGILLERLWKMVTGKRVGGWVGTAWVYFSIMVLGQPCVDSWLSRGLAGGMVIPPPISPTRKILWPLLSFLFNIDISAMSYHNTFETTS